MICLLKAAVETSPRESDVKNLRNKLECLKNLNTIRMGKTLHIMPSGASWSRIAYGWIGRELDQHDILQYPVRTNIHYLPEDFSEVEMMKVAISWNDAKLYDDLKVFARKLSEIPNYDKVIVWHAEDADSRLLFCTIVNAVRQTLYEIDITPEERRSIWKEVKEDEPEPERDVDVFYVGHVVGIDGTRSSYPAKRVTAKMRETLLTEWRRWGGEDAQDCPVLVSQYGELFHTYRTYLYQSIFEFTPKTEAASIARIAGQVLCKHPQVWDQYVCDTVVKMADEGMIKWVKKDDDPYQSLVQQYKYDVEEDWLGYPRDFLYHFIDECGKKITMSEDDLKAEYRRDIKDCDDLWGHGHLTREYRQMRKKQWKETLVVRWAAAFNENWGWYHLLSVIKVKLEMMAEYMRQWTSIERGAVYAAQMERTVSLIRIILDHGGESDYAHADDEDEYLDAGHFSHYVNFRNRSRIPSPDYCGELFWCKAQRLRFDKAWNLLWEIFRTRLLSWED